MTKANRNFRSNWYLLLKEEFFNFQRTFIPFILETLLPICFFHKK